MFQIAVEAMCISPGEINLLRAGIELNGSVIIDQRRLIITFGGIRSAAIVIRLGIGWLSPNRLA